MSTHRRTWQRKEQQAASLFGSKRQIGSGSGGRPDQTCSDSTHPRLFIETKLRASSATHNLWEATRALARREGKVPVLALYAKSKPGALLVVHEDDLAAVARELAPPASAEDQPGNPREPSSLLTYPEPFESIG